MRMMRHRRMIQRLRSRSYLIQTSRLFTKAGRTMLSHQRTAHTSRLTGAPFSTTTILFPYSSGRVFSDNSPADSKGIVDPNSLFPSKCTCPLSLYLKFSLPFIPMTPLITLKTDE